MLPIRLAEAFAMGDATSRAGSGVSDDLKSYPARRHSIPYGNFG
jgi:hypothetical protein